MATDDIGLSVALNADATYAFVRMVVDGKAMAAAGVTAIDGTSVAAMQEPNLVLLWDYRTMSVACHWTIDVRYCEISWGTLSAQMVLVTFDCYQLVDAKAVVAVQMDVEKTVDAHFMRSLTFPVGVLRLINDYTESPRNVGMILQSMVRQTREDRAT
jgi:hypothetical protein